MDYNEYISAVSKVKEIQLGESDLNHFGVLLEYETEEGLFSIYKIYSYYKRKRMKHAYAYKNIHQKTQKLFSLGLIEEVKGKILSLHGAKFYRLSVNGWFNVIMKRLFRYSGYEKAIIKFLDKNIFFKTFLYPYFEPKTVEYYLKKYWIPFLKHLENCCAWTLEYSELKKRNVKMTQEGIDITLIDSLDLVVKTFLIRLAMDSFSMHRRYQSERTLGLLSILSNDKKFLEALKNTKIGFEKSYEMLIGTARKRGNINLSLV
jgi:hypothetical protein